ncbi:helix-turn-helix transcriptional regulator [Bacillus sp. Marseille-Q1617]|uniref:helix-turn-helix transcriptional regulator n=1 Tax=Bacillus sp. Marseille-Q1617 TaxID=2736887 RepID=UPI001589F942|nr:helix-turn-helix transcriptional regulator [Bacillus sp. Marseille-Q1617]
MENNIKAIRKSKGLSQKELANACSVSRQTINAIENDKYDPTLSLAFHLSVILETPLEKLFTYSNRH